MQRSRDILRFILTRVLIVVILVVPAFIIALQLPSTQTALVHKIMGMLDESFDGSLSVGSIKVQADGSILAKDVLILDRHPYTEDIYGKGWDPVDTVAYIRSVSARLRLSTLLGGKCVEISRATVEDGLFHLTIEPGMKQNLMRVFGIAPPPDDRITTDTPEIFNIGKVRVRNFRFRLTNFDSVPYTYSGHGLDFSRLDVTADIVEGRRLRMDGDVISGICDHAEIHEKSGYRINHVEGNVRAGMGKVIVNDIILQDPWSDLDLKCYEMHFDGPKDFINYVEKVRMVGIFKPSILAMETVSYFAGEPLKGNGLVFDIQSGKMDGTVNDFFVTGFRFKELHSGMSGVIDGRSKGIPYEKEMGFDARASNLTFTTSGLSAFISNWARANINLGSIAPGKAFVLNATTDGPLNNLHVKGTLNTSCGNVDLECRMSELLDTDKPVGIMAIVDSKSLRVGELLDITQLGEINCSIGCEASLSENNTDIHLDSLRIRSAEFNGYTYRNIFASGQLKDNSVKLRLKSNDPACRLKLGAHIDLKKKNGIAHYRVNSALNNVDLAKLNFVKGKGKAAVSMALEIDAVNNPSGYFSGKANIKQIRYDDEATHTAPGDISLTAAEYGNRQSYRIDSELLTASYLADRQPTDLIKDIQNISTRAYVPAIYPSPGDTAHCGHYDIRIKAGDMGSVLPIITHGLYIEKGTEINLLMEERGTMDAKLTSGRIALGPNFLKNTNININNRTDALLFNIGADELKLANFSFNHPELTASAASDRLGVHIGLMKGEDSNLAADINMNAQLFRDSDNVLNIEARPLQSKLDTDGQIWDISPASILLHNKDIHVKNFRIASGDEHIRINGNYRPASNDTLRVDIHQLGISLIDRLFQSSYGLEGTTSGRILLVSKEDSPPLMFMNILMDSLKVGGTDAGNIHLRSVWDKDQNRLSLLARNTIGKHRALQMIGHYNPNNKHLRSDIEVDSLDLGIAAPFLRSIVSETGGSVSGKFSVRGKLDNLVLASDNARFNDALVRIAFTGVPYTVSGPFSAKNEGIFFDGISIHDDSRGTGQLSGSLRHNSFRDMVLDARLSMNNIKVLDIQESGNESFYGKLNASGEASICGPFEALRIEGNIRTSDNGNIHVPLSGSLSGTSGNLLNYTEHKINYDPYDLILQEYLTERTSTKSDMRIKVHVSIHPGVSAFMEIDKDNGNVVSFNGQGQANIDLHPSNGHFSINGDYNIRQGKYHFVLPGIMEKDLSIQDGSSIAFGGDLMDTRVNITAGYKLKAPLSSLLTDVSGVGTRRNVECGLTIGDKIRNPNFKFFINIPDLDPALQSEVESALNTEDKIQKQFVALLLMGSFLPSEQSGVFNGTNMLYSNLTEVVSSQMSNILKKLDIPLDFGFRFQESNSGNNVFDVALSTQLFNNRVIVSGSVGNRQYKPASSAVSDVVGDVDIQVKLNKTGLFRLNLFSHSADERTSFLDYSQRNGIGLSFQKDFRVKRNKNKKQKEITIRIDNESGKAVSDTVTVRGK